tara:strand:+ start:273 stop:527 length:255 start_codon:yes stop_codon:yes gene_type:complete
VGVRIDDKKPVLYMEKWEPTETQQSGEIARTFDFLIDELNELQEELSCPDEFIYDFLEVIQTRWSSTSCHARARQHKKDNPDTY